MEHKDYPALYLAADQASNEAQSRLITLSKWTNFLLILGATLAIYSGQCRVLALISAIVFLGSLFLVIYGRQQKLQEKWYEARALAESIKTATWRLMMRAEPFSENDQESDIEKFGKLLNELLSENKGIGQLLSNTWAENEQVTPYMLSTRDQGYQAKSDLYLTARINEQRAWYAKKSGDNRLESSKWIKIICFLYGGAILCLLTRIAWPHLTLLPTDVFAVAASCALGWTQLKKFDELASAYGLTAHEIGIIKSRHSSISSAAHLSSFVSDAENAFSREHTQWAARRDR
jgi:hypothetical protein